LNTELAIDQSFQYDLPRFIETNEIEKTNKILRFEHRPHQKEIIDLNRKIFGQDAIGLSRLLSQVYIKKLFRTPVPIDYCAGPGNEDH
jgi:hypothetical protein